MDEQLDLVNDKDEVVGIIGRDEFYKRYDEKLGNIRAVEFYIENDKGQLWVPTRTANKRIAPNGLDYSAGGHVSAGEDYITSLLREVEEELGLQLKPEDMQLVGRFTPDELPYFRNLYIYKSNEAPDFNPDDFVSGEWLYPEEVIAKIDAGVLAKTNLRKTVAFYIASKQ